MDDAQRKRYLREAELRALFAEVTGFLNARPLTYQSGDPSDLCALTPNHFLLHRASPVIHPETRATDGYRSDYAFPQRIADEVWRRWSAEYVPTLTKRAKWNNEARNLEVGDTVLIVDGNAPRGKWIWGVVKEVQPNADGRVRRAVVKTPGGEVERPAAKLCLLEESSAAAEDEDGQTESAREENGDGN